MKQLLMASFAFLATAALTTSCGDKKTTQDDFVWKIDRFDDINVLRYQVEGFDSLSAQQHVMLYYLSQAAICGRDIMFDQNCKYNLPIRRTLEAIYTTYKGDRTTEEFLALEKYLKKVWFANGIHHHYSGDKFTPEFTQAYFEGLLKETPAELLPAPELLAELTGVIFDPTLYAKHLDQRDGIDMLAASASNYYSGVTQQEAEAFYAAMIKADGHNPEPVSYGLNSQLVKEDGKIFEKTWKVGGMYGAAIEQICYWLEKAAGVAENDHQRESLELLISYYRTGDLRTFDLYNIHWVKDTLSQIDLVNGFTETYGDPLGYKASWESMINFKDIEATKRTELISKNAQWFEDNAPIAPQYRKPVVKGISAKTITAAMLGGDCYPATPIGINLPNADWIRKEHGSKSVTVTNITAAYDAAAKGNGFTEEFILRPEDRELKEKWGSIANNLHTDLHECLGHASGQLGAGVKGDELKNYGSTLEEARADLFALYYMADPMTVQLGISPSLDVAKAEYNNFMMNGLQTQLTRIQPGKNIEESHMRDRSLIAHWVYENGKADNVVELRKVTGDNGIEKTYVVVNDYAKLRTLFGDLLREIQRVKSEGDFETGRMLVETYGVKVDPAMHDEVLRRYAALNIAPYSGFVNPRYVPVTDAAGHIVDARVEYPDNYVEQMLDYSANYSFVK